MLKYCICLCLFLSQLTGGTITHARRGISFHQTFKTKDHYAGTQNWSITQDNQGLIYIGNSLGILKFDASNWQLIKSPSETDVYSVSADNSGNVYAGLFNDFGKIAYDSSGNAHYKSLSKHITEDFGQIYDIFCIGTDIYFYTDQSFIYHYNQDTIRKVYKEKEIYFATKYKNKLLLQILDDGFYFFDKDTSLRVDALNSLKSKQIAAVHTYNKSSMLLVTFWGEFFIFDGDTVTSLQTEISGLIEKYYLMDSQLLPGNLYAFVLDPYGVVIINSKGQLVYLIDLESNLISQSALSIFFDNQNGLWIGTNDDIVRYEFSTPYTTFYNDIGLKGGVTDIISYNNHTYVGTLGRCYKLEEEILLEDYFSHDLQKRYGLSQLEQIRAWVWDFQIVDNNLIIVTDAGLYKIDPNDKTQLIYKAPYISAVTPSAINKKRIFFTGYDSLFSGIITGDKLTKDFACYVGHGGNYSVESIADTSIWISSYDKGYFKISITADLMKHKIKQFTAKHGLPANNNNFLKRIDDKLLFLTKRGVFRFDNKQDLFIQDTISALGKSLKDIQVSDIYTDSGGNIFISSLTSTLFFKKNTRGLYTRDDSSFARIYNYETSAFFTDQNKILFGGGDGIITYDGEYLNRKPYKFKTLFTNVLAGKKNILGDKHNITNDKNDYLPVSPKHNTITFKYTIPSYDELEYNQYQYYLEGFDEKWSEWSAYSEKEYINLPWKKYIFHVRARNVDHIMAEETTFAFEIITPWYATLWAFLLYIITGILIIVFLVRWRSNKLNHLVNERTRELTEANKQLVQAKAEADQAAHSRSVFLANMSHEIRTPLNGILGMNQLLSSSDLQPEQKEYVDAINLSAETLLNTINDILDFSKIDAGRMEIERIPFKLSTVIEGVIKILKNHAYKKDLKLIYFIENNLPELFISDPHRIRQILLNFGSNAIKFTQKGSVELKVFQQEKNHTDKKDDVKALRFVVSDTGIGIPVEKQKYIFESFSQADSSTTREFGGTGLGLTICKLLAELLGGNIGLHSIPGKGSTFWFDLQLEVAATVKSNDFSENIDLEKFRELNNLKVLIAEDNPINYKFLKRLLEKNNIYPDVATNGKEAVEMVHSKFYDIILMDIQMPVMDGFEATVTIRKMQQNKKSVIIALTANAVKGDREKCLEKGMDDYLSKPVKMDALFRTIVKHYHPTERFS